MVLSLIIYGSMDFRRISHTITLAIYTFPTFQRSFTLILGIYNPLVISFICVVSEGILSLECCPNFNIQSFFIIDFLFVIKFQLYLNSSLLANKFDNIGFLSLRGFKIINYDLKIIKTTRYPKFSLDVQVDPPIYMCVSCRPHN